jgi:hypothetical protein
MQGLMHPCFTLSYNPFLKFLSFLNFYFGFVFGGMGDKFAGGPEASVPCFVILQITPVPGEGKGKGPAAPNSNDIAPISTT